MIVRKTDIDIGDIDRDGGFVRGGVTFFFDLPGEHLGGTAHYQCKARLHDFKSTSAALKALAQEAARQASCMPEYRLGARRLTFAAGAFPGGA